MIRDSALLELRLQPGGIGKRIFAAPDAAACAEVAESADVVGFEGVEETAGRKSVDADGEQLDGCPLVGHRSLVLVALISLARGEGRLAKEPELTACDPRNDLLLRQDLTGLTDMQDGNRPLD